jgi:hypothetical protein
VGPDTIVGATSGGKSKLIAEENIVELGHSALHAMVPGSTVLADCILEGLIHDKLCAITPLGDTTTGGLLKAREMANWIIRKHHPISHSYVCSHTYLPDGIKQSVWPGKDVGHSEGQCHFDEVKVVDNDR